MISGRFEKNFETKVNAGENIDKQKESSIESLKLSKENISNMSNEKIKPGNWIYDNFDTTDKDLYSEEKFKCDVRDSSNDDVNEHFSKDLNDKRVEIGAITEQNNLIDNQYFEKLKPGNWIYDTSDIKFNNMQNYEKNSYLPKEGGAWTGEPGNSEWVPDNEVKPKDKCEKTNPQNQSWDEIKKEYNFNSIKFKDGEPDFSEVSKGTVEIDNFTDNRAKNFNQADEKLAQQRGCSPEEVKKWRKENNYTWHECKDCKTMQKVPSKVHGNIPHSGGIAEKKKGA